MVNRRNAFSVRLPLALPGQRIGLLGGSFNPAHQGHRLISEIARKSLRLDAVWWIVSPGNPLKSHAELAPLATRTAEAQRVSGSPHIRVTDFEAALTSRYTVDTLAFLKQRLPHVRFVWLMGADNLATLHRWRRWRQIFALMPVAVVDRPGWHLKAVASHAARTQVSYRVAPQRTHRPMWVLLTGQLSSQSSTALRARPRSR
jgi:nicotinate-nucleotide adenylyltransferase